MFRFYLNNNLVSDAINWADFTETIERDDIINGLLPKYDVKLQFNAGGYTYLYDSFNTNGFCNLVELKVDYTCDSANYKTILNGYIFLSDCKFNLNKCLVDCDVIDNNYGARIYNNKSVKTYINADKSKNGVAITPCATEDIQLFTPTTAIFGVVKKCYILKDAFRYLIDFMSDNTLGFESDFLDSDPNIFGINYLRLMAGGSIRGNDALAPFISFEQLFSELNKKYPISFTTIVVNGKPTIKIENASYFYNNSNAIKIDNIQDLFQSINTELLYSSVKFGGDSLEYNGTTTHFPETKFFNFEKEEYYLQSECNIDKVLDLIAEFISDSNIIEEIYVTNTSNSSYDKNVFFIESSSLNLAQFAPSPLGTGTPYYFNANLTNNKVAERYSLAGNIALYLGNSDDGFMASLSANITDPTLHYYTDASPFTYQVPFNDDSTPPNNNINGNYNNANYRYTAPSNGVYGFKNEVQFKAGIYTPQDVQFYYIYEVYDSGNVLQFTYNSSISQYSPTLFEGFVLPTVNIIKDTTFYIPATYYVTCKFAIKAPISSTFPNSIIYLQYLKDSYWKTETIENGGGVYEAKDIKDYFASKLEFDRPLSNDEYEILKQDLSKSLIVNHDGVSNKTAWIRKTIRKLATGETKFELISNLNNT